MSFNFITFGCWNSGICSVNGVNGMSQTMRALNDFMDGEGKNKTDFLLVTGDNYYMDKPEKNKTDKPKTGETKIKTFNLENMKSGFECLKKLNIPEIHILNGNHEWNDYTDKEDSCSTIREEKKIMEEDTKFIHYPVAYDVPVSIEKYYKKLNDSTLLIFIESTMYDMMEQYLCYMNKNGPKEEYSSFIEVLMSVQANILNQIAIKYKKDSNIQHVIFAAHHPLLEIKYKVNDEGKGKLKYEYFPQFVERIVDFKKTIEMDRTSPNIQYYHICADLHQYQHATLEITQNKTKVMTIEQYVVGTGGAKQDQAIPNSLINGRKELEDSVYSMEYKIHESIKEFGFMNVFHDGNSESKIQFVFYDKNNQPIVKPLSGDEVLHDFLKGGKNQKKRKTVKKRKKHNPRKTNRYKRS